MSDFPIPSKYIYLIFPKPEYNYEGVPSFVVLATNDNECWDLVYKGFGFFEERIAYLNERIEIEERFEVFTDKESKVLYPKQD